MWEEGWHIKYFCVKICQWNGFLSKKAVLNRIKMCLVRMCLCCGWQLFRGAGALQPCLTIRSSWGQIRDGGVTKLMLLHVSFQENFKMFLFTTVQKRRPDLLCFIEPLLKNYLLSLAHHSCHPIVFALWKAGADLMATLGPFKPLILQ